MTNDIKLPLAFRTLDNKVKWLSIILFIGYCKMFNSFLAEITSTKIYNLFEYESTIYKVLLLLKVDIMFIW